MAFNINEFRSNLVGDGARPNLFAVTLVFPAFVTNGSLAGQKTTFLAKSAQLPGSSIGTVPLPYFGRQIKLPGNRTFADWTLQIINDEDFIIRNALEEWSNGLNNHEANKRNAGALSGPGYSVDATVTQYGKTGDIIKTYDFQGMFPVDIAPIDLDWGNNDSIEEYPVTFAYQLWKSNTTT